MASEDTPVMGTRIPDELSPALIAAKLAALGPGDVTPIAPLAQPALRDLDDLLLRARSWGDGVDARLAELEENAEARAAVKHFLRSLVQLGGDLWDTVGREALKSLAVGLIEKQVEKHLPH